MKQYMKRPQHTGAGTLSVLKVSLPFPPSLSHTSHYRYFKFHYCTLLIFSGTEILTTSSYTQQIAGLQSLANFCYQVLTSSVNACMQQRMSKMLTISMKKSGRVFSSCSCVAGGRRCLAMSLSLVLRYRRPRAKMAPGAVT